ncbi:hypothetical protein KW786_01150 [Candidatus Parcubacteria bacterium]|nr:hypothetical protein [Candidatus Parcubacteria bacterium]
MGNEALQNAAETATKGLVGILLVIPLYLSGLFALSMKYLLQWTLSLEVTYISSTAVTLGWPIVRDFANMIIILALIIISLATIVRYKDYEAKRLLPALIIAALLINFSLVICAIFIDGSNIVMKGFVNAGGNSVINNFEKESTAGVEDAWKGFQDDNKGIQTFAIKTIGEIFFNTMSGLVLMLYLFLFLFRIFALWMLLILSPLAFACYVLPSTKKVFDMWWTQFLNWCIIGMSGGFFYMLANRLQGQIGLANPPDPDQKLIAGLVDLYAFIVPGAFMVIGFLSALQTSAMGSGMAIGAFKKTVGAIRTGASATGKYVGGWAANRTGASRLYDNVKNRVSDNTVGLLERVGAVRPGTAAAMRKNRVESTIDKDTTERIGSISKKDRKALIEANPYDKESRKEKAAAVKIAAEKGELKELDEAQQRQAIEHGMAYGMSASDFAKTNPVLAAELDKKGQQAIIERDRAKGKTTTEAQAETELRKKYYKQYEAEVPARDSEKVQKVRDSIDPTTGKVNAEGAKIIDEMAKDGTLGKLKDVFGDLDGLADAIEQTTEDFGSNARKGLLKLDPRQADRDREAVAELQTQVNPASPAGANYSEAEAERELVRRANSAIAPREIDNLDTEAIDERFVEDTTAKKLKGANNLSKAKILKLKSLLPALRSQEAALNAISPRTAEQDIELDSLTEKIDVIEKLK